MRLNLTFVFNQGKANFQTLWHFPDLFSRHWLHLFDLTSTVRFQMSPQIADLFSRPPYLLHFFYFSLFSNVSSNCRPV